MKKMMSLFIAVMVAFVCVQANADYTIPRYYPKVQVPTISPEHPDYVIPDGSDHELLPPILPCVYTLSAPTADTTLFGIVYNADVVTEGSVS